MRQNVDTFTGLARRAAAAILASDLAGAVARPAQLAPDCVGERANYLSVELSRCGGVATAAVYMSADGLRYDGEPGADGDTWASYDLHFDVSWSSWGTDSLARAAARSELIADAVRLATRLEVQFGGRHQFVAQTAAERAEYQARVVAAKHQRVVAARVVEVTVGLRRGGFVDGVSVDAPAGTYEVVVGKKRFRAVVGDSSYMGISRLDDEVKS